MLILVALVLIQEVRRIRHEHPEDPSSVVNGRVKGSLKVTRAFGAGYLKQVYFASAISELFLPTSLL